MREYKKLENQPLKFVLAEFRFSPVMQISEYIPKIQDALRKQYPIPEKKAEQAIQVQPGGIAVSTVDRWAFISASRKSAVEINQERLVYVTAEYPRFEGFSDSCRQALETLIDILEPSLIFRIGLRYSDLVTVEDSEKITDLVNDSFGLPVESIKTLGAPRQHSTDTFLNTEIGGLAIRTLYGNHNLTCLPDAQGLPISIKSDASTSERLILDFDHFWEAAGESVSLEADDVLERLSKLHKIAREAFWKVTTDYARNEKWA